MVLWYSVVFYIMADFDSDLEEMNQSFHNLSLDGKYISYFYLELHNKNSIVWQSGLINGSIKYK